LNGFDTEKQALVIKNILQGNSSEETGTEEVKE
jgi:hypothetical protein